MAPRGACGMARPQCSKIESILEGIWSSNANNCDTAALSTYFPANMTPRPIKINQPMRHATPLRVSRRLSQKVCEVGNEHMRTVDVELINFPQLDTCKPLTKQAQRDCSFYALRRSCAAVGRLASL